MGKLDDFIRDYANNCNIQLNEAGEVPIPPPAGDPMAADPLAGGAPPPAAPPPAPEPEVKEVTSAAYASHVEDMIMMLRIGMAKGTDLRIDDSRVDKLFDENPRTGQNSDETSNVETLHDIVKELINDYASEVD